MISPKIWVWVKEKAPFWCFIQEPQIFEVCSFPGVLQKALPISWPRSARSCPMLACSVWPQSAGAVDLIATVGVSREPWWWSLPIPRGVLSGHGRHKQRRQPRLGVGAQVRNEKGDMITHSTRSSWESLCFNPNVIPMIPHQCFHTIRFLYLLEFAPSITHQGRITQTIIRGFKNKSTSNSRT